MSMRKSRCQFGGSPEGVESARLVALLIQRETEVEMGQSIIRPQGHGSSAPAKSLPGTAFVVTGARKRHRQRDGERVGVTAPGSLEDAVTVRVRNRTGQHDRKHRGVLAGVCCR